MNANPSELFTKIYKENFWNGPETACGPGSSLGVTAPLRALISGLIGEGLVKSILDVGCGDAHWIQYVQGITKITYVGVDVVDHEKVVKERIPGARFLNMDYSDGIVRNIPKSDLVLCKDVMIHLPLSRGTFLLESLKRADPMFLFLTNVRGGKNTNINMGQWFPADMCQEPFRMRYPDIHFEYQDLSVWKLR